jgi:hypothetical protein
MGGRIPDHAAFQATGLASLPRETSKQGWPPKKRLASPRLCEDTPDRKYQNQLPVFAPGKLL